jgi:hypothetical protein
MLELGGRYPVTVCGGAGDRVVSQSLRAIAIGSIRAVFHRRGSLREREPRNLSQNRRAGQHHPTGTRPICVAGRAAGSASTGILGFTGSHLWYRQNSWPRIFPCQVAQFPNSSVSSRRGPMFISVQPQQFWRLCRLPGSAAL